MVVLAVALLLLAVGSLVVLDTLAVSLMTDPLASLLLARATTRNVALALAASVAMVSVIVPPAALRLKLGPLCSLWLTSDRPAGRMSLSVTLWASLVPALLTVM